MIDYILFVLINASFVFVSLSALFICKQKQFEDERLVKGVNSLIAGMSFLAAALLVKGVQYGLNLFSNIDIVFYASIAELVCISLMIVFFLVGMTVLKEV